MARARGNSTCDTTGRGGAITIGGGGTLATGGTRAGGGAGAACTITGGRAGAPADRFTRALGEAGAARARLALRTMLDITAKSTKTIQTRPPMSRTVETYFTGGVGGAC
ncbi:MAG TPA: hypothetical protein VGG89_02985 [Candidatus Baltobacteraceae bacterium]